jgi:hypothetical protein
VIKEPVRGDKRWVIRWLRRPLEICCLHHMHLSAGGACHTAGTGAGFVPSVLGPQKPGGPSLLHGRNTHTAWQEYGVEQVDCCEPCCFHSLPLGSSSSVQKRFSTTVNGKSAGSSKSLGPTTELHGLTPQKPVIYSRFHISLFFPVLHEDPEVTGRPMWDY